MADRGKGLIVAVALVLLAVPALAQEDPRLVTYRQLLSEANERVATFSAQVTALQLENGKLKAELEKAKPPAKEGDKKKD